VLLALGFLFAAIVCAQNLDSATRELARRIESVARGKEIGALTVRNVSSLPEADAAQVRRLLETELRGRPARGGSERVTAQVTLSENIHSYLWVALISDASRQDAVMLNVERTAVSATAPTPLSIQKKLLWEQERPILDAEVSGDYLIVLEPSAVFFYRGGQLTQSLPISSSRPMPRDPRGRLVIEGDSFRALAAEVACSGTITPAPVMVCAESSAWPLAPGRNYFSESGVAPYFSSALLPGRRLLAGLDGHTRVYDNSPREIGQWIGWGSDITAVDTGCGAARVVLASKPGDATESDEVRIYNFVDRAAIPIGEPAPFSGPVTALWDSPRRGEATAIARNPETARYAAYSLAINCGR
jgi:hypothetical protein